MNYLIAIKGRTMLILELGKIRIAQLVTLSTAMGYILATGRLSLDIFVPVSGILLLALGSGALNQYQEYRKDLLMPRTRNRPIPSGRIRPSAALAAAIALMISGSLILYFGTNSTALFLGLFTAFWYNGVYTYLKRVTPMAVIPGSLIGAIPPLVGWTSGGGDLQAPQAIAVALVFFIWQIPHFWLLLLNFGGDYEKAGYPSLTSLFSREQLGRLTFMWIVATAGASLFMPLFGLGNSAVIFLLLFLSAAGLVWTSTILLRPRSRKFSFLPAFKGINYFILSVMILLTIDRLI